MFEYSLIAISLLITFSFLLSTFMSIIKEPPHSNTEKTDANTPTNKPDQLNSPLEASEWLKDINLKINLLTPQLSKLLTNSILLVGWAIVNLLIEYGIGQLHLTGFSLVVIRLSQTIFLAATLAPVVLYFYLDTRQMIIKAQHRIQPKSE